MFQNNWHQPQFVYSIYLNTECYNGILITENYNLKLFNDVNNNIYLYIFPIAIDIIFQYEKLLKWTNETSRKFINKFIIGT